MIRIRRNTHIIMENDGKDKNGCGRRGLCMLAGLLACTMLFASCQTKGIKESDAKDKESEISELTQKEGGRGNSLVDNGKMILTAPDIFLTNIACGYRSEWSEIRNTMVMVENREGLESSMDQCGAGGMERGAAVFPYLGGIWSKIPAEYPIEDYTYFFYYEEVSCGGYSLHADKLVIDGDQIYFGLDETSHGPAGGIAPAVMDGFGYLAAVPKKSLAGKSFGGRIMTPDPKAYMEAAKKGEVYGWYYADHIGDTALSERYWEQLYVMGTQEQYDTFLEKAQGAEVLRKDPFAGEIDFTKTVLACTFLNVRKPIDEEILFQWNGYKLLADGKLRIYYHFNEYSANEAGEGYASLLYVLIPRAEVEQAMQEARQDTKRQGQQEEEWLARQNQGEEGEMQREAEIITQSYVLQGDSYALTFRVRALDGVSTYDVLLPTESSNAVMKAQWISERVLAIETHVNPSTLEFFLYDVMAKKVLRQYVGGAFWVIPGTDHVLYEENVPHFSTEPVKHVLFLDDKKVYTVQREDYRIEGLVFSEDHSRVAFLEEYVRAEELSEEKRARSASVVMCELTVVNPSMKERIVIPAVDPDHVQKLFFTEDNEFCMMKDGKVYSCEWSNSLFREAEIEY